MSELADRMPNASGVRSPGRAPAIARTRSELAHERSRLTGSAAVVMTMGALHEGHATLFRRARERYDVLIGTIFLNPLQFGRNEDLAKYPRTFDADLELVTREGVDLLFAPGPDVVYPDGDPGVRVSAGRLGALLEGASRPGHFDGVLTVVSKMLHLTRPDAAFFGQKDAQQVLLVRRMVTDLDFPCEVVTIQTVRDADGLALSSRNIYLSDADRHVALALSRSLRAAQAAAGKSADTVRAAARAALAEQPGLGLDYAALVDPANLGEVRGDFVGEALLVVAARVGTTRLIDNAPIVVGTVTAPVTDSRKAG